MDMLGTLRPRGLPRAGCHQPRHDRHCGLQTVFTGACPHLSGQAICTASPGNFSPRSPRLEPSGLTCRSRLHWPWALPLLATSPLPSLLYCTLIFKSVWATRMLGLSLALSHGVETALPGCWRAHFARFLSWLLFVTLCLRKSSAFPFWLRRHATVMPTWRLFAKRVSFCR